MKQFRILLLALCAMFITTFAVAQGGPVGEGEIPEATVPVEQAPLPREQAPEPPPVQQPFPAPISGDSPTMEPEVLAQSGTRTTVRYRTVNNRTIVRQVDSGQLKKLQNDFAAYQREVDRRFQLTKEFATAKADKAYVMAVGTANRYTDRKVDALEKKLEPRLAAVEEQGNGLALVIGVLGILGLAGLFMALLARR